MNEIAGHLNALSPDGARSELLRCCGSRRWARRLVDARPFAGDRELIATAERVWWEMDEDDWREAFAAHPRIGERASGWSATEQAGMDDASAARRREIDEGNRRYESRFGHVFLICADGRSAEEMAAELRRRLDADPAVEMKTAAAEQAKITRLRLGKLVER